MSSAEACVLVTSSAWLIVRSSTTTTPVPAKARGGGTSNGVAEIGRPVIVRVRGGAHRAGHDHRRLGVEDQVPEERCLLDDVGALDDDDAVDRRVGLAAADLARDLEQLRR